MKLKYLHYKCIVKDGANVPFSTVFPKRHPDFRHPSELNTLQGLNCQYLLILFTDALLWRKGLNCNFLQENK